MEIAEIFGRSWGQRDDEFIDCLLCGCSVRAQPPQMTSHRDWHMLESADVCPRCFADVAPGDMPGHLNWHDALRALIDGDTAEVAERAIKHALYRTKQ